jgi:DNA ligase D-like protein (predicted 3'-phosphoesterase)
MSLNEYLKKRNFSRTPEPNPDKEGRRGSSSGLIYVIQKHRASQLHFDLRLEEGEGLASWAIPKTPPTKEGEKRLAVETEVHPLSYAEFEGEIPEGEYGAGTVEIWDKGTYLAVESAAGKKIIDIKGDKLRGRYALIKIKPRERERDANWLFFKLKKEE